MLRSFRSIVPLAIVVAACGGSTDQPDESVTSSPTSVASATATPTLATTAPPTSATAAPTAPSGEDGVQACADVVDASLEPGDSGYRVSATVRSGDTGWEKYADAWVVRTTGGEILGERILTHPHETEQPFTRSLSGVAIPSGVTEVEIAARDSVNGFCGQVFFATVGP